MKKSFIKVVGILVCVSTFSQAPEKFRYQAVIRDANGNIMANQPVELAISILSGSATGPMVYSEKHSGLVTNAYGLVNLTIGEGKDRMGEIGKIDWGSNAYYLSLEILDGTSWVSMGSSQLLSVPYAVYSNKAGSSEAFRGYEAGEGVSISKTGVITNTAPDQPVTFTSGTGISVSGTYPAFTITNTLPNATHSGDASGNGLLRVKGIQGRPVADSVPNVGDALKWNGSQWVPAPASYIAGSGIIISPSGVITNTAMDQVVTMTGTGITVGGSYPNFSLTNASPNATHSGDASGSTILTVTGLQGKPVSPVAPEGGQFMQYDGSLWAPASLSAGKGLTYSNNQFAVNGMNTIVTSAQNAYVISGSPSLDRASGGVLTVSGNGTISIPVTIPVVLNGILKKLSSVSINYLSATLDEMITMTVVKDCYAGNGNVILRDNTRRNSTTWETYILTPVTPYPLQGSLVVEISSSGFIVLQNITVVLQD